MRIEAVKNNRILPNIADHIRLTNHNISPDNVPILHVERKGQRLNLLEAYEINKSQRPGTHLLNYQLNPCPSPILNIKIK